MSILTLIVRELVGMFIDDEFLAIAVLAVVGIAALILWFGASELVVGTVPLLGCIGVLMASVSKANRRS